MFKKTLIAFAISGVLVSTADLNAAATIVVTGGSTEISIEGSASKDEVLANDIVVTLGAEYSVSDVVTFTFTGADLDVTTPPASISVDLTGIAGFAAGDKMTLGLIGTTTTSTITYRVTELNFVGITTTIGAVATLAGLEFDTASLVASGAATVAYSVTTGAFDLDVGTKSADLLEASSQFTGAVTVDMDAVIDVETQRVDFVSGFTDSASVKTTDDVALTYPATGALFTTTLNGDFDFLDDDAKTAGIQLAGAVSPVPTAVTSTSMTFPAIAAATTAISITVPGDIVIPTTTFTADIDVAYTDHGTAEKGGTAVAAGTGNLATATEAGAWSLNGSVVNVPYMPMGPNTQPILRHTNIGAQTGDITVRYMVEGVDTKWVDGGTLIAQAAPGVRNLLTEVNAMLLAAGYDRLVSGFKVALEFTTNVPGDDVTVFAAAKINAEGQDRVSIGAFGTN